MTKKEKIKQGWRLLKKTTLNKTFEEVALCNVFDRL